MISRKQFSLENFTVHKYEELFRFSNVELYHLTAALLLPKHCRTRAGHVFTGKWNKYIFTCVLTIYYNAINHIFNSYILHLVVLKGLGIVLACMSTPAKLCYNINTFHGDRSALSRYFCGC